MAPSSGSDHRLVAQLSQLLPVLRPMEIREIHVDFKKLAALAKNRKLQKRANAGNSKRLKSSIETDPCESSATKNLARVTLDSLPVEVLQNIFFYRTNLELPLVSRKLYAALTTESVKERLVKDVFVWEMCTQIEERIPNDMREFWNTSEHATKLKENQAENEAKNFDEEQLRLLNQKWFTFDLFRKCQQRQLSSIVTKAVHQFTKSMTVDDMCWWQDMMWASIESNLHWGSFSNHYVYQPRPKREAKAPLPPWKETYSCTRPDGATLKAFMPDDRGLNTTLILLIEFADHRKPIMITSVFPALTPGIRVPPNFLRGPWTQVQGTFLELFINACPWTSELGNPYDAAILFTNAQTKAARAGLSAAIRAWCFPAARLLLGSSPNTSAKLLRTQVFNEDLKRLHPQKRLLLGPESKRTSRTWQGRYQWIYSDDLRLDSPRSWRAINDAHSPAWKRWYTRDIVTPDHLVLVCRKGPVGRLGWAWFHWLGAHMTISMDGLRGIAASTRAVISDPARLEMVDALAASTRKYYTDGISQSILT